MTNQLPSNESTFPTGVGRWVQGTGAGYEIPTRVSSPAPPAGSGDLKLQGHGAWIAGGSEPWVTGTQGYAYLMDYVPADPNNPTFPAEGAPLATFQPTLPCVAVFRYRARDDASSLVVSVESNWPSQTFLQTRVRTEGTQAVWQWAMNMKQQRGDDSESFGVNFWADTTMRLLVEEPTVKIEFQWGGQYEDNAFHWMSDFRIPPLAVLLADLSLEFEPILPPTDFTAVRTSNQTSVTVSWTPPALQPVGVTGNVYTSARYRTSPGWSYEGDGSGSVNASVVVEYSTDGGATWTPYLWYPRSVTSDTVALTQAALWRARTGVLRANRTNPTVATPEPSAAGIVGYSDPTATVSVAAYVPPPPPPPPPPPDTGPNDDILVFVNWTLDPPGTVVESNWMLGYPEGVRTFLTEFTDPPTTCPSLQYRDADTGELLTVHPIPESPGYVGSDVDYMYMGPSALADGQIYLCGWASASIWRINAATGAQVWRRDGFVSGQPAPAFASWDVSPLVSHDGTKLYLGNTAPGDNLTVLSTADGSVIERVDMGNWSMDYGKVLMPDGSILFSWNTGSVAEHGLYRLDLTTGAVTPFLILVDHESLFPYAGNYLYAYQMSAHPHGEGFVMAVMHHHNSPSSSEGYRSTLVEVDWGGNITNTYTQSLDATQGSSHHMMYSVVYSSDGTKIYATTDTDIPLVWRFLRGAGSYGGGAPFMHLDYLNVADWQAAGSPMSYQTEANNVWNATAAGAVVYVPVVVPPPPTVPPILSLGSMRVGLYARPIG